MSLRAYLKDGDTASEQCKRRGFKIAADKIGKYIEEQASPFDPIGSIRQIFSEDPTSFRCVTYWDVLAGRGGFSLEGFATEGDCEILVKFISRNQDLVPEVRASAPTFEKLREMLFKVADGTLKLRALPGVASFPPPH